MKRSNKPSNRKETGSARGLIETLVVIALILIIPLFFVIRTRATQELAATMPAPAARSTLNVPENSAAAKVQQPPQCTFPLAQVASTESAPGNYTFSEPKVVLTAAKGNIHNVFEWLPDNKQILITENLHNSYVSKNDNALQQSINLYNVETGESVIYAMRAVGQEPPAWQPNLNAVVYPATNYTSIDKKAGKYEFTRQAWVSYGNPSTAQLLADNLTQAALALKPGGGQVIYFSDKEITRLDKSLKHLSPTSFNSAQWDYAKGRRNTRPVSYEMAWQPDTSLIFLYSEGAMGGGGYTFIMNAYTGRVCELNLGGWAQVAGWSPDGRYLAFIRSTQYTFPDHSADLVVLDGVTGRLIVLNVIPKELEGLHFVDDFVWAPDNRHLLATASIDISPTTPEKIGLYLVDFVSGQSTSIIPSYAFYTNAPRSMAWSSDGSKLAIRCPASGMDRICLISIQNTGN